jgi:hypothetical protein
MALPIACNTLGSLSFTLYHLQLAIFPFVPSYRLQQYLFVCKRILIGMSPYPPSTIGYYHPMIANSLVLQKLPSGKPHYFLS